MPGCCASGVRPIVGSVASMERSLVTSQVLLLQLAVRSKKAMLAKRYFFMFDIVLLLSVGDAHPLHIHKE